MKERILIWAPHRQVSGGELLGVVDASQEMKMRGQEHEGVQGDAVEPLCPAEDAEDDVVDSGAWPEQEPPLQSPCGDLHERALGHVA